MGLRDVVVDFLTTLVVSYADESEKKRIGPSFTKTKLDVKDLTLHRYAFMRHGCPFVIDRGVVGSILVNLPWSWNMLKEPIEIVISGVYISARCVGSPKWECPNITELLMLRHEDLNANEGFRETFLRKFSAMTAEVVNAGLVTILGKALVTIENVNVNLEFDDGNRKAFVGVSLGRMEFGKLNPKNVRGSDVERGIMVRAFGIVAGRDAVPLDLSTHETMRRGIGERLAGVDCRVFGPNDVSGAFYYEVKKTKFTVDVDIPEIVLSMEEWQIKMFADIMPWIERFRRFWAVRKVLRPRESGNLPSVWRFAHACALQLEKKRRSRFSEFIRMFKQRSQYMRVVASGDSVEVKKMEQELSYHQVIMFRLFAMKKELKRAEVLEIIDFCDKDRANMMDTFLRNVALTCQCSRVFVAVDFEDKQTALSTAIFMPSLLVQRTGAGINVITSFSSIHVKIDIDKHASKVIESFDRHSMDFAFNLTICNDWMRHKSLLLSSINCNMLVVNSRSLQHLMTTTPFMRYVNTVTDLIIGDFDQTDTRPTLWDIEVKEVYFMFELRPSMQCVVRFNSANASRDLMTPTNITVSGARLILRDPEDVTIIDSCDLSAVYENGKLAVTATPTSLGVSDEKLQGMLVSLDTFSGIMQEFRNLPVVRVFTRSCSPIVLEVSIPSLKIEMRDRFGAVDDLLTAELKSPVISTTIPGLDCSGTSAGLVVSSGQHLGQLSFDVSREKTVIVVHHMDVCAIAGLNALSDGFFEFVLRIPRSIRVECILKTGHITVPGDAKLSVDVADWNVTCKGSSLRIKGMISGINLDDNPVVVDLPVTATAEMRDYVNVDVKLQDVVLKCPGGAISALTSVIVPFEMVKHRANFTFNIARVIAPDLVTVQGVTVIAGLEKMRLMCHFTGDVLDLGFCKSSTNRALSGSFDLAKKRLQVVVNYGDLVMDKLQMANFTAALTSVDCVLPAWFQIRTLPFTVTTVIAGIDAHFGIDHSIASYSSASRAFSYRVPELRIRLGEKKLATFSGVNMLRGECLEWRVERGFVNFNTEFIPELQAVFNEGADFWKVLTVGGKPMEMSVARCDVFVNNAIVLGFDDVNIGYDFANVVLAANMKMSLMESFFVTHQFMPRSPVEFSVGENLEINAKLKETTNLSISPQICANIISTVKSMVENPMQLRIENRTNIDFTSDVGPVHKQGSVVCRTAPHFEILKLESSSGFISMTRDKFDMNTEFDITLENGESLFLRLDSGCLTIEYAYEIRNATDYDFELCYGDLAATLVAHGSLPIERVKGKFKLNDTSLSAENSSHISVDGRCISVSMNMRSINIQPLVFVYNGFPFDLIVSDGESTATMSQGERNGIAFLEPSGVVLNLSIQGGSISESLLRIDLGSVYSTLTVVGKNGTNVRVRVQVEEDHGSYVISFMSSSVFHNHLRLPIYISYREDDAVEVRTGIVDATVFSPVKGFCYSCFLWLGTSGPAAELQITEKENNHQLHTEKGIVHVVTTIEEHKFWNVVHVHIYPAFIIRNATRKRLMFKTASTAFSMDADSCLWSLPFDARMKFAVAQGDSGFTKDFNLANIRSQDVKIEDATLRMTVTLETDDPTKTITFTRKDDVVIKVVNSTDAESRFIGGRTRRVVVRPHSSEIFMPATGDDDIEMEIANVMAPRVSIPISSRWTSDYGDYTCSAFPGASGMTMINITDSTAFSMPVCRMFVKVENLDIDIHSMDNSRMATAHASDIYIAFDRKSDKSVSLSLSVASVSVYDIGDRCLFKSEVGNFMSIRMTAMDSEIDTLSVDLSPFSICVDPSLLSHYNKVLLSVGSGPLLVVKRFILKPSSIVFSRQSAFCSAAMIPRLMRLTPAVLPFTFDFDTIDLSDFCGNLPDLIALVIMDHPQRLEFMRKAVGSLTAFGAPMNHFNDMHISNVRSVMVIPRASCAMAFGVCESVVDYASAIMKTLGGCKVHEKDTEYPLIWGITSLFGGVVPAAARLARAPCDGWHENGPFGLVSHTVSGVFQFSMASGSSALDCVSGVLCSLRGYVSPTQPSC